MLPAVSTIVLWYYEGKDPKTGNLCRPIQNARMKGAAKKAEVPAAAAAKSPAAAKKPAAKSPSATKAGRPPKQGSSCKGILPNS